MAIKNPQILSWRNGSKVQERLIDEADVKDHVDNRPRTTGSL